MSERKMYHLRRIGPPASMPGVPDIMDFERVTYLIGRSPSMVDYVIDSSNEKMSLIISRSHARIVRQAGNSHRLFDDSLNGVFVNNIKIEGSCFLQEGDRVTFGHPTGSKLPAGIRVRQPDSEYQFLFEECSCPRVGPARNSSQTQPSREPLSISLLTQEYKPPIHSDTKPPAKKQKLEVDETGDGGKFLVPLNSKDVLVSEKHQGARFIAQNVPSVNEKYSVVELQQDYQNEMEERYIDIDGKHIISELNKSIKYPRVSDVNTPDTATKSQHIPELLDIGSPEENTKTYVNESDSEMKVLTKTNSTLNECREIVQINSDCSPSLSIAEKVECSDMNKTYRPLSIEETDDIMQSPLMKEAQKLYDLVKDFRQSFDHEEVIDMECSKSKSGTEFDRGYTLACKKELYHSNIKNPSEKTNESNSVQACHSCPSEPVNQNQKSSMENGSEPALSSHCILIESEISEGYASECSSGIETDASATSEAQTVVLELFQPEDKNDIDYNGLCTAVKSCSPGEMIEENVATKDLLQYKLQFTSADLEKCFTHGEGNSIEIMEEPTCVVKHHVNSREALQVKNEIVIAEEGNKHVPLDACEYTPEENEKEVSDMKVEDSCTEATENNIRFSFAKTSLIENECPDEESFNKMNLVASDSKDYDFDVNAPNDLEDNFKADMVRREETVIFVANAENKENEKDQKLGDTKQDDINTENELEVETCGELKVRENCESLKSEITTDDRKDSTVTPSSSGIFECKKARDNKIVSNSELEIAKENEEQVNWLVNESDKQQIESINDSCLPLFCEKLNVQNIQNGIVNMPCEAVNTFESDVNIPLENHSNVKMCESTEDLFFAPESDDIGAEIEENMDERNKTDVVHTTLEKVIEKEKIFVCKQIENDVIQKLYEHEYKYEENMADDSGRCFESDNGKHYHKFPGLTGGYNEDTDSRNTNNVLFDSVENRDEIGVSNDKKDKAQTDLEIMEDSERNDSGSFKKQAVSNATQNFENGDDSYSDKRAVNEDEHCLDLYKRNNVNVGTEKTSFVISETEDSETSKKENSTDRYDMVQESLADKNEKSDALVTLKENLLELVDSQTELCEPINNDIKIEDSEEVVGCTSDLEVDLDNKQNRNTDKVSLAVSIENEVCIHKENINGKSIETVLNSELENPFTKATDSEYVKEKNDNEFELHEELTNSLVGDSSENIDTNFKTADLLCVGERKYMNNDTGFDYCEKNLNITDRIEFKNKNDRQIDHKNQSEKQEKSHELENYQGLQESNIYLSSESESPAVEGISLHANSVCRKLKHSDRFEYSKRSGTGTDIVENRVGITKTDSVTQASRSSSLDQPLKPNECSKELEKVAGNDTRVSFQETVLNKYDGCDTYGAETYSSLTPARTVSLVKSQEITAVCKKAEATYPFDDGDSLDQPDYDRSMSMETGLEVLALPVFQCDKQLEKLLEPNQSCVTTEVDESSTDRKSEQQSADIKSMCSFAENTDPKSIHQEIYNKTVQRTPVEIVSSCEINEIVYENRDSFNAVCSSDENCNETQHQITCSNDIPMATDQKRVAKCITSKKRKLSEVIENDLALPDLPLKQKCYGEQYSSKTLPICSITDSKRTEKTQRNAVLKRHLSLFFKFHEKYIRHKASRILDKRAVELQKSLSTFFKLRRIYAKMKTKPVSVVRKETVQRLVRHFFKVWFPRKNLKNLLTPNVSSSELIGSVTSKFENKTHEGSQFTRPKITNELSYDDPKQMEKPDFSKENMGEDVSKLVDTNCSNFTREKVQQSADATSFLCKPYTEDLLEKTKAEAYSHAGAGSVLKDEEHSDGLSFASSKIKTGKKKFSDDSVESQCLDVKQVEKMNKYETEETGDKASKGFIYAAEVSCCVQVKDGVSEANTVCENLMQGEKKIEKEALVGDPEDNNKNMENIENDQDYCDVHGNVEDTENDKDGEEDDDDATEDNDMEEENNDDAGNADDIDKENNGCNDDGKHHDDSRDNENANCAENVDDAKENGRNIDRDSVKLDGQEWSICDHLQNSIKCAYSENEQSIDEHVYMKNHVANGEDNSDNDDSCSSVYENPSCENLDGENIVTNDDEVSGNDDSCLSVNENPSADLGGHNSIPYFLNRKNQIEHPDKLPDTVFSATSNQGLCTEQSSGSVLRASQYSKEPQQKLEELTCQFSDSDDDDFVSPIIELSCLDNNDSDDDIQCGQRQESNLFRPDYTEISVTDDDRTIEDIDNEENMNDSSEMEDNYQLMTGDADELNGTNLISQEKYNDDGNNDEKSFSGTTCAEKDDTDFSPDEDHNENDSAEDWISFLDDIHSISSCNRLNIKNEMPCSDMEAVSGQRTFSDTESSYTVTLESDLKNSDSEGIEIADDTGENMARGNKVNSVKSSTKRKCNFGEGMSPKIANIGDRGMSATRTIKVPTIDDGKLAFKSPPSTTKAHNSRHKTPVSTKSLCESPDAVCSTQILSSSLQPDLDDLSVSQMTKVEKQLLIKAGDRSRTAVVRKKACELLAKMKAKKENRETDEVQIADCNNVCTFQGGQSSLQSNSSEAEVSYMLDEQPIKSAEKVIQNLKIAFETSSLKNNERINAWSQELSSLEQKLSMPKTVIAVVGGTGEGKSSLMNALLDHRSVLPTSGIRACTAVVVEMVHSTSNNEFVADIEFLQRKEWYDELQILIGELSGPNGVVRKGAPDATTDTYVSYCKVKAVYGKIEKFELLSRMTAITSCLGTVKTIRSQNPEDFRKKVEQYIQTKDHSEVMQYWPIVKHVRLRMPNCDVLSSGAVLVDLPGVRDSNAARDKIAKEYLKNCTAVWVVSSIHRAIDDKTAKTLLGDNFRRQLLMDGQYGSLAFICSKTDILIPSEIIRNLKLESQTSEIDKRIVAMEQEKQAFQKEYKSCEEEVTSLKCRMNTLKKETAELQSAIDGFTSLLDPIDVDSEQSEDQGVLEELQEELKNKEKQIEELEIQIMEKEGIRTHCNRQVTELENKLMVERKDIATICTKARNEYARDEIKKDFKSGLREMKRQASVAVNEEADDYGDDNDSNDENGSSADNLPVFCCSATEYQKMRNLLTDDGPSQVLNCIDDTEIPCLRNYVHEMTKARRRQAVDRLIRSLGRFVFDLQNYTADNMLVSSGSRQNVRTKIDVFVGKCSTSLCPLIDTLSTDIEDAFCNCIWNGLKDGTAKAVLTASKTCSLWGTKKNSYKATDSPTGRKSDGLPYPTYMATVTRAGEFRSPTYGPINFNEDLTDPVYRCLTIVWDKVFSELLWKCLEKVRQAVVTKLEEFSKEICLELKEFGVPEDRGDMVCSHFLRSANNKLEEMVVKLKEGVTNNQRDISRILTPHIQEKLDTTYLTCSHECGSGAFQRMKDLMSSKIDKLKHTMFLSASEELRAALVYLKGEIVQHVKEVCNMLLQDLKAAFQPLWEVSSTHRTLQTRLKDPLLEACIAVREIYRQAGLSDTEEQVRSQRTAVTMSASSTCNTESNIQTSNVGMSLSAIQSASTVVIKHEMSVPVSIPFSCFVPMGRSAESISSVGRSGELSTLHIKQEPDILHSRGSEDNEKRSSVVQVKQESSFQHTCAEVDDAVTIPRFGQDIVEGLSKGNLELLPSVQSENQLRQPYLCTDKVLGRCQLAAGVQSERSPGKEKLLKSGSQKFQEAGMHRLMKIDSHALNVAPSYGGRIQKENSPGVEGMDKKRLHGGRKRFEDRLERLSQGLNTPSDAETTDAGSASVKKLSAISNKKKRDFTSSSRKSLPKNATKFGDRLSSLIERRNSSPGGRGGGDEVSDSDTDKELDSQSSHKKDRHRTNLSLSRKGTPQMNNTKKPTDIKTEPEDNDYPRRKKKAKLTGFIDLTLDDSD